MANFLLFKEDIKIPVPWGYLTAKVWGPDNGDPVLALHGWQDNAGTFDTLAPLLPSNIRLVCLEFCGHGHSSHLPPGMFLSPNNYLYQVKLVADYFKWDRFTLIGHSMGGQVAILYTSIYPDQIVKLVSLDALKMLSSVPDDLPMRMRGILNAFEKISSKLASESSSLPAVIDYNQAREKMMKSYRGSLESYHDADILLRRNLKKFNDRDEFVNTRDLRSIIPPYLFHDLTTEQLKSVARSIPCPFLLIKASDSLTSTTSEPKEMHEEFIRIYADTSREFRCVEVDGKHHIHLSRPDVVAPHITNFLNSS